MKLNFLLFSLAIVAIVSLVGFIIYKRMKKPAKDNQPTKELPDKMFTPIGESLKACGNPPMWQEIDDFLTEEECDEFRAWCTASNRLEESKIGYDWKTSKVDPNIRISKQLWVAQNECPVAEKIAAKTFEFIQKYAGCYPANLSRANLEKIQVVQYGPGGKYTPHYDGEECGGAKQPACPKDQRISTMIIYLSDEMEGGETHFPKLNVAVKPKKGKALFFWVADKDNHYLFDEMYHGGAPVTKGEKWIANQWIRTT
jgi:prolyl 4-hydroxylase